MNFEINKLRVDEVEINIKAIVQACLQKMKFIIICGVVCGVLLSTLVYGVDIKSYNESQNMNTEVIELTDSEKVTVDTYLMLQKRIKELQEYEEKSLILSINVEDIYQGDITFHIESEEDAQYDIASAITNAINDTIFVKALREYGIDTPYEYGFVDVGVVGVSTGMSSGVFNVRVYAHSETDCKAYMDIALAIVNGYSVTMQDTIVEHKIDVTSETYGCGYSDSVYAKQKAFIDNWQQANALLTASQAALNANQLMYINALNTSELDENEIKEEKPEFSILLAIIGVIVGAVAGIAIVCAQVIFGGKIQTEQELLKRLSISNLGTHKELELVVARIENMIQNTKDNSVGLVSTTDALMSTFIQELQVELKEKNIVCESIGNIVKSPESYNKAANKKIILVEVLGKTKIKDVYDESMACKNLGVEVIGYITMR